MVLTKPAASAMTRRRVNQSVPSRAGGALGGGWTGGRYCGAGSPTTRCDEDFRPDSDVDVLVEFEPGHTPGLAFFRIERELSDLLGRTVDLNTPRDLSRHFRDRVRREAEVLYAA